MPDRSDPFDNLAPMLDDTSPEGLLDYLEQRFRNEKAFPELFEVLKMRARYQLGLPLISGVQPTPLSNTLQRDLEDRLLDACREVGTLLIQNGQLEQGWMYLQPVGDHSLNQRLMKTIHPTEENLDTLIEICVTQGAAPVLGFGLLLEHYGTCNAITTFDMQGGRFDKQTQKGMAEQLLRHLYEELVENLRNTIITSGTPVEQGVGLAALMAAHPERIGQGEYHIDTTHLASVVRIARLVDQPDDIRKGIELVEYGQQLPDDLQYASPPPFEATYLDHRFFYDALLGNQVETAVEHFEKKCKAAAGTDDEQVTVETLVDFLVRVGKRTEAIEWLTSRVLGKFSPLGIAPSVFEIAQTTEQLERVKNFYRSCDDLLGFAMGMLKQQELDNAGQPGSVRGETESGG